MYQINSFANTIFCNISILIASTNHCRRIIICRYTDSEYVRPNLRRDIKAFLTFSFSSHPFHRFYWKSVQQTSTNFFEQYTLEARWFAMRPSLRVTLTDFQYRHISQTFSQFLMKFHLGHLLWTVHCHSDLNQLKDKLVGTFVCYIMEHHLQTSKNKTLWWTWRDSVGVQFWAILQKLFGGTEEDRGLP
jgi:hypothetical protein